MESSSLKLKVEVPRTSPSPSPSPSSDGDPMNLHTPLQIAISKLAKALPLLKPNPGGKRPREDNDEAASLVQEALKQLHASDVLVPMLTDDSTVERSELAAIRANLLTPVASDANNPDRAVASLQNSAKVVVVLTLQLWLLENYSKGVIDGRFLAHHSLSSPSANEHAILHTLSSWDFDVWDYSLDQLFSFLEDMFVDLGLVEAFDIPIEALRKFLWEVSQNYNANPYHNFVHACDVTQTIYLYLKKGGAICHLSKIEVYGLMVAAVCHDLDHHGLNNTYQVNASTPLSQTYNDQSVLENYHAALCFQLLNSEGAKPLLQSLSPDNLKSFRRVIIDTILHTDMQNHFELVSKLSSVLDGGSCEWGPSSPSNHKLLLQLLLHAADISNVYKSYKVSCTWVDRLCDELDHQADAEVAQGLPPTAVRSKTPLERARFNISFLEIIAQPFFKMLPRMLPKLAPISVAITRNVEVYKTLASELEAATSDVERDAAVSRARKAGGPPDPDDPAIAAVLAKCTAKKARKE